MIIELFGMPGAGKSTLARRLVDEFGFERVSIQGHRELLVLNVRSFFRNPFRYYSLLRYAWVDKEEGGRWSKFANLLHYHARYEKARGMKKAILDQGYLQNLISVFSRAISIQELERYIKVMPLPDALAVFTQPADLTLVRTSGRRYEIREREGDEAFRRKLAIMEKNIALVLENQELLKRTIISVDGRMPTIAACQHVLDSLASQNPAR